MELIVYRVSMRHQFTRVQFTLCTVHIQKLIHQFSLAKPKCYLHVEEGKTEIISFPTAHGLCQQSSVWNYSPEITFILKNKKMNNFLCEVIRAFCVKCEHDVLLLLQKKNVDSFRCTSVETIILLERNRVLCTHTRSRIPSMTV